MLSNMIHNLGLVFWNQNIKYNEQSLGIPNTKFKLQLLNVIEFGLRLLTWMGPWH